MSEHTKPTETTEENDNKTTQDILKNNPQYFENILNAM